MRLLPLIAATYFMVSGGPYGLEDIIGSAGYGRAIRPAAPGAVLLESAGLADDRRAGDRNASGGWLLSSGSARAMGPFWGFQEGWLSLAASVFDMAIYPTTFVLYLTRVAPVLTAGHRGLLLKFADRWDCLSLESAGSCIRGYRFCAADASVALAVSWSCSAWRPGRS